MLHRILIPRLLFLMQSADIDLRVTTLCGVFLFWLPERNEQHPLLANAGIGASVFVCLSVLMAVRRITLITVTTVNVIFYHWKNCILYLFFKWPNMTDICDSRRCGFSSPSVIWWISADVRPQNRHVKIFVVHSFNRSCLTRHFWLIFYISPCIQIKSRARCLSSLHFRDVNKRRSECARRDAGQLLSDQSPITPTAVPILKAFGWRVINRK